MKGAAASGARLWPRLSSLLRPSDFARTFGVALRTFGARTFGVALCTFGARTFGVVLIPHPFALTASFGLKRGLSARPFAPSVRGLSAWHFAFRTRLRFFDIIYET